MKRLLLLTKTAMIFLAYSLKGDRKSAIKALYDNLCKLGGIYAKFLQLLIIREDISDPTYDELKNLLKSFDDLPIEPINIRALLISYGQIDKFEQIDSRPFATGSFAQVYGAKLVSGELVVLKVLRPSVKKHLRSDLSLLSGFTSIVNLVKRDDFVDIKQIFSELKVTTLQETDYYLEIHNATRLYNQHKDDPILYIPRTYVEFSSRDFIVQERVSGMPLTELISKSKGSSAVKIAAVEMNTDLALVMEKLAYENLRSNLTGTTSHADPHPGNIILLRDNRVALIDFGIQGHEVARKAQLVKLLREYVHMYDGDFRADRYTQCLLEFFVPDLMDALKTITQTASKDIKELVMDELAQVTKDIIYSENAAALRLVELNQPLKLFIKVINRKNRFAVRADFESLVLMRSTNMYLNLLNQLDIDRNISVKKAYERIVNEFDYMVQADGINVDSASIDKSMHVISGWLDRLRYSDPLTYNRIKEVMA